MALPGRPTIFTQSMRTNGHMDFDNNYVSINYDAAGNRTGESNYLNALNITQYQSGANNQGFISNVNGNTLAFNLPNIAAQDKIYQLSFQNSNAKTLEITFLNLNGTQFNVACVASITTTGVLSTDTTSFGTAILNALIASGFTASTVVSSTPGIIDIMASLGSRTIGFDYTIMPSVGSGFTSIITTVTKEAIDASIAGLSLPVGSTEVGTDLFIFSSSQTQRPGTFNILSSQASLGGDFQINIAGNVLSFFTINGNTFGGQVVVSGVSGATGANGIWINSSASFNSISPGNTTITLFNSTFAAGLVGGTVSVYEEGFLCVTVAQKNESTGTWTATNLLETKAINSRAYNLFKKDVVATVNNEVTNIYWTDGSDSMRLFSYTGPYFNNGAIKFYNPNGFYTYEGVGLATVNIIGSAVPTVQVQSVVDGGGEKVSGNWRYTGRFLDSFLTPSSVGILSQPVNIYNGNFGTPASILGTPGETTAMQVNILVSDIPLNTYSYFELIGVQYIGDTETPYLIKRVPIPTNATSLNVTDTGTETYTNFTDGFTLPSLSYKTAQAQTIVDNAILYGNLTTNQITDFTAFSQTFTHILQRDTTSLSPLGDDVTGYTLGEYQIPVAVGGFINGRDAGVVGYMLNETYRFWACYQLKDGTFTNLFWVDDVRFDLASTTNIANPFNQTHRRTGNNIPSYDLTGTPQNSPEFVNSYVFYVTFQNNNLNFTIDGTPVNELVEKIYIFRTDNSQNNLNEVLASGLIMRHVFGSGSSAGIFFTGFPNTTNPVYDNPLAMVLPVALDMPVLVLGANGNTYSNLFGTPTFQYAQWVNYAAQVTPPGNKPAWAHSCSFYSPDWMYGQANITFESGNDYLFSHGQPNWMFFAGTVLTADATVLNDIDSSTTAFYGTEVRLSGYTDVTTDDWNNRANIIEFQQPVSDLSGVLAGLPDSLNYCGGFTTNNDPLGVGNTYTWSTPHHIVLYNTSEIAQPATLTGGNEDIGMYYGQYYRNLKSVTAASDYAANPASYPSNNKFGAITTGTGIPTGYFGDADTTTGTISIDVYGGDTFNQKSFLKLYYPNLSSSGSNVVGGGLTCVIVTQNRMNFNMRNPGNLAYPQTPDISVWINFDSSGLEIDRYDLGYTPRNIDNIISAFDPSLGVVSVMPNRIIYSLPRPESSLENLNRIFPPFNFYDLADNDGGISRLASVQGELVTYQPGAVYRQFYNDTGTLDVQGASSASNIGFGSSDVFSKPGFLITSNGSSNNYSTIYGVGINGEDVVAWLDIISNQVCLLSRGSCETISLTKNMRSFFKNNLQFITGDDPIDDNGIVGVFDAKRKQFVWTVRGKYQTNLWSSSTTYNAGDIVQYGGIGFEGYPGIYVSLQGSNLNQEPDISPVFWAAQSWMNLDGTVNNKYYNYYTIVYSLLTGGFTSFLTPKPYFYAEWKDTYLTADPNASLSNALWEDDLGAPCTWYSHTTPQTQNGVFIYAVNENPREDKRFIANLIHCTIQPNRLDSITFNALTWSLTADYLQDRDAWVTPIHLDATNTNTPYGLSSILYGRYMVNKITLAFGVEQQIFDIEDKFTMQSRRISS